jgi:uncharacterized damage-inducible protein DinB
MYRRIEDFTRDWAYEIESTSKVMNTLTDESLGQKVTPDGRSLGFIAWHIVITLGEMPEKVGLHIDAPAEDAPMPATAAEIAAAFETAANSIADAVAKNWTDETLEVEDEMYGDKWKRGTTLHALILHQAHHRGQMTVLMRQAGLPVPGIYGPSREEWEAFGMPAAA